MIRLGLNVSDMAVSLEELIDARRDDSSKYSREIDNPPLQDSISMAVSDGSQIQNTDFDGTLTETTVPGTDVTNDVIGQCSHDGNLDMDGTLTETTVPRTDVMKDVIGRCSLDEDMTPDQIGNEHLGGSFDANESPRKVIDINKELDEDQRDYRGLDESVPTAEYHFIGGPDETVTVKDALNDAVLAEMDTELQLIDGCDGQTPSDESINKRETQNESINLPLYNVQPNTDTCGRSLVTAVTAPARVRFKFLEPDQSDKSWTYVKSRSVLLVPRYALSVLAEHIGTLKSRMIYEPAFGRHALADIDVFQVENMYVMRMNSFAVQDAMNGNCMFVFYGGRDIVDSFKDLPSSDGDDYSGDWNRDLFTAAIYFPSDSIPNIGSMTYLPVATRHMRMLIVFNSDEESRVEEGPAIGRSNCKVFGTTQLWFRDLDNMRDEFRKLQRFLCIADLIRDNAFVTISFTVEIPKNELIGNATGMVENIWKHVLSEHDSDLYSRIPVELFVDHSRGYFENEDFDSVTVHGFFLDGKTYARIVGGDLQVCNESIETSGDVQLQSLSKASTDEEQ